MSFHRTRTIPLILSQHHKPRLSNCHISNPAINYRYIVPYNDDISLRIARVPRSGPGDAPSPIGSLNSNEITTYVNVLKVYRSIRHVATTWMSWRNTQLTRESKQTVQGVEGVWPDLVCADAVDR
jgi:hypothetical protein